MQSTDLDGSSGGRRKGDYGSKDAQETPGKKKEREQEAQDDKEAPDEGGVGSRPYASSSPKRIHSQVSRAISTNLPCRQVKEKSDSEDALQI